MLSVSDWLFFMKVPSFPLIVFGIFAFLQVSLQAAFIQSIYFGYRDSNYSHEDGYFTFQYQPGLSVLNGQNGSIDWMTWSLGNASYGIYLTQDLVRDGVVVPDCAFEFTFNTITQGVGVSHIGFLPGYFIYGRDLRYGASRDENGFINARFISPINYFDVGEAQVVPESGSTGAMMLGSLFWLGMTGRKRTMREASGRSQ
jgi:hypothetical protein